MGIQFIDNQPITWRTNWATDSDCKTPYGQACTLYSTNDYLMAQWKQTPCGLGANLWCNPTFSNPNPELVTNGNFATATGWTFSNASHDAVNLRANFTGAASGYVQSTIGSISGYHQVQITVGGNTGGHIKVSLRGGTAVDIYGQGTFTVNVLPSNVNTLLKIEGINFNGWVDTVSVKLNILTAGSTTDCWDSSFPQRWAINTNGTITKLPGNSDTIGGRISNFIQGGYYKISLTVSSMTAGSISVELVGTPLLGTITANGVYEYWVTAASSNVINLDANNLFDGTIGDLEVVSYSNFFNVILRDTKGATIYDLSSNLTFDKDYVTLKYLLGSVTPSCYELCFYDACGYNLNTQVTCDTEFNDAIDTSWQYLPEFGTVTSATISGSKFRIVAGTPAGPAYISWLLRDKNSCSFVYPTGVTNAVFQYTLKTLQVDEEFKVQLKIPGATSDPFIIPFAQSNSTYTGTVNLSFPNGFVSPNYDVRFNTYLVGNGISNGEVIEIDYFKLEIMSYVPGQATEYCSNCIEIIDYPDTEKCSLWIGGSNDSDAFGFNFDNGFQVGARVRAMMINPKYKGDSNRYADANGKYTVTKANTGKIYTLFIDYTDEHTHDWLRVAALSDTVRIGPFTNTNNFYTATDGDYEPEWPDNLGNWPSAQARIDMQKQTDELYNNNAG